MDAMAISLSGLKASTAQLDVSAANVVRSTVAQPQASDAAGSPAGSVVARPLAMASPTLDAALVAQQEALAAYRANLAMLETENRIMTVTLELIG